MKIQIVTDKKKVEKIKVKPFKLEDAKFLLNIHNVAIKNRFFISKKIVKYKEHLKWLNKILSNSYGSIIYIGYFNNKKFGYVRFDKTAENIYEVSIANHLNFIGKGLRTKMLNLSIKKFVEIKKPKKIVCIVKKNNIMSQKCFLKNNFKIRKFNKKKHRIIRKNNAKDKIYFELNLSKKNRIQKIRSYQLYN